MLKKILSFFIFSVLLFVFFCFDEINAKGYSSLSSSSNVLEDNSGDIASYGQYYVPEYWTSREQEVYTYGKTKIYEDYFKRYRPLFYWNYHRIQAFEDGYKDLYATSKISGFRVNNGPSSFTVNGSTEISETKSHNFELSPEVKEIKLGGYSYTAATTVSNVLGASWSLTIGPNSPSGYYGFYTISYRTKYSIYHMYSKSNQDYNLEYNIYEDIFMFDTNTPDIIFLYTGNQSLA